MRPAPAPPAPAAWQPWRVELLGRAGWSRSGSQECRTVGPTFGSVTASSSPSFPVATPLVSLSSTHLLPVPLLGSAPSSSKPPGQGEEPLCLSLPTSTGTGGANGGHNFWTQTGLKPTSATEKLCDPGQFI